jgi:hypothetical protein
LFIFNRRFGRLKVVKLTFKTDDDHCCGSDSKIPFWNQIQIQIPVPVLVLIKITVKIHRSTRERENTFFSVAQLP